MADSVSHEKRKCQDSFVPSIKVLYMLGRGTPDSGIDESVSHQSVQAGKGDDFGDVELLVPGPGLLSEEDKAAVMKRPASSFTGLRRGQLEGKCQLDLKVLSAKYIHS